jgi:hypothetical protein
MRIRNRSIVTEWGAAPCAASGVVISAGSQPTLPGLAPIIEGVILSRDTDRRAERRQVEVWRRMSPAEKAALVTRATEDALMLALAGIRQRHPGASERECFLRLAEIRLGASLVRAVYSDAAAVLDGRP